MEIVFEDSSMTLGMSQEEFDQIGAESEEFFQKLLQSAPADASEGKNIAPASNETESDWALAAYEAMWAAAYQGRKEYGERIYTACGLNGAHWVYSCVAEAPAPCPVCFKMMDLIFSSKCGHLAYQAASDCLSDGLPCADSLQHLDDTLDHLEIDTDAISRIREIPDVSLILENLACSQPWFLGFECARDLRTLSVECDIDRWGDTDHLGFHANPEKFLAELTELEQRIIDRLKTEGVDLENI